MSINELLKTCPQHVKEKAEDGLELLGLTSRNEHRRKTFRLLEANVYPVNEGFPSITPAHFKEGVLPPGTSHLSYRVDLGNLERMAFDAFLAQVR